MKKFLYIAGGVVAGALGGALVVLLIAFVALPDLYDLRSWVTSLFILAAMALAALVGGVMGAVTGISVAEGHTRRAAITFAGTMGAIVVLTLLGFGGLWAMTYMPSSGPSDSAKEKWARTRGPLDPQLGLTLAHQLIDCHDRSGGLTPEGLDAGGCTSERSFLIGKTRTSYDQFDNGWRWESVKTPRGYKVVVRPDPLLKQPGPMFEFDDDRLLVQRAAPGALPYAADSPLAAVEPYRRCLSANGPDGCRDLERSREPPQNHVTGPAEWYDVTLNAPEALRSYIRLFPAGRRAEGKWELQVAGSSRRYMFQQDGEWHVTATRGVDIPTNPPPHPCELDPKVPCNTEAQQAVADAREKLYVRIATRIRSALWADSDDLVIVRFDPQTMPGLDRAVEKNLRPYRAELVPYGPVENLDQRLAHAVGYVWLPTGIATPADQLKALARWTDKGGRRQEIHVHWMEGTLDLDGRPTTHPAGMDERYIAAAETNTLFDAMDRAISVLSTGEVHVTTPAGTDIRFRTMGRPFNRQMGSGSGVDRAKIRIDRHIEIPPGVLRVAPLETTVNGVMVFPSFWIRDGVRASDVRLEFTNGRITRATARDGQGELNNYLRAQPALMHFREFCLGMNPQLALQPGEKVIPYYGYGAGVVRMSLGDNEELGGTVRGGAVRWNFFVDATVMAGDQVLVKAGRLMLP